MEQIVIATYQPEFKLNDYQYLIIVFYLHKNKFRVLETAKELGIGKSSLYRFIQLHPELSNQLNDEYIRQLHHRNPHQL